ncbi:MAG: helix-turn-helix transcriptional regulator [Candidatus Woesearchaeota archaeon]
MKNHLLKLWLIIGIISGFAAIVFFILTYLNEEVLCNLDCREKNEVQLILILLSLFGLFVGSMLYYFISERYRREIRRINKDVNASLAFLEPDMRRIVESIIMRAGAATQADITKDTQLSRVKISRAISKLEQKGIVEKSQNGMTNIISLRKDLKELFVSE